MIATVQLDNPQGIINSLQARIEQLENMLKCERQRNAEVLPSEVGQILKYMRLLCIIPLYVGSEPLADIILKHKGDPVLREALDAVCPLANAPVSEDVKNVFQVAANNGMNRWF